MRDKLIQYVNGLFSKAPATAQVRELHDEILQNTLDRYDDEVASGRSEREAYDAAVAAIGDVDALLTPLCPKKHSGLFLALGVCCYILALVPPIMLGDVFGAAGLFVLAAAGTVLLLLSGKWGRTANGRLRAAAVGMYILSPIPPILLSNATRVTMGDTLGAALMIVLIAAATVPLVLSANGRKKTMQETQQPTTVAAAIVEKNAPPRLPVAVRIIIALLWVAAAFAFTVLVFWGQWFYAWALFPFTGAVTDILRGVVLLVSGKRGGKYLLDGILWIVIMQLYWFLTCSTGAWYLTWILMPLGALATGVLHGIFELVTGRCGIGRSVTKIVLCGVFGLVLASIFSSLLLYNHKSDRTLTLNSFGLSIPTAEERGYSSGTAELPENTARSLRELELKWSSGNIRISCQDVDTLVVQEVGSTDALRWKLDGGTLSVRDARSWRSFLGLESTKSDLEIILPMSDGKQIGPNTAELSVSSAKIVLNDLHWDSLDVDSASGSVTATNCAFGALELDSASGGCTLTNSSVGSFEMDTASGCAELDGALGSVSFESTSGDLTVKAADPLTSADINTVSGNIAFYLPENSGFTAKFDSVSGDFLTDGFAVNLSDKRYICGDGSADYQFHSVSGDVSLHCAE